MPTGDYPQQFVTFNNQIYKLDVNGTAIPVEQSYTTTTSPGALTSHDPIPDLQKTIKKLEEKVERLQAKLERLGAGDEYITENDVKAARFVLQQRREARDRNDFDYADDPDVAYFQRNLHSALKVPAEYLKGPDESLFANKLKDLNVGPNDVLVIHIRTNDIPRNRIEAYLRRAKQSLKPMWEKLGLKDRVIFMAGEGEHGFSVIHVEEAGMTKAHKEMVDYARATTKWVPRKPRPPVMG